MGTWKLSQLQNSENIGSLTIDDLSDFKIYFDVTIHNPVACLAESFLGDFNLVQETLFALWHAEKHVTSSQLVWFLDEKFQLKALKILYEEFKMLNLDVDMMISHLKNVWVFLLEDLFSKDVMMIDSLALDILLKAVDIYGEHALRSILLPILASFSDIDVFKSKKVLENSKDYFEQGGYLFRSFVSNDENFAQMFPACPNHVYIDLPKKTDQEPLSTQNAKIDSKKQQDYDAELRVFRALEQINKEQIAVLHGLRYSHHQYRMWMSDHNFKECASCRSKKLIHSDEGEHDFVVLGADYIAIIEVKNSEKNASDSLSSAKDQLGKLTKLIEGISRKSIQLLHSDEDAASKPERNINSASLSKREPINEKQIAISEHPLLVGKNSFHDNDYQTIKSSEKTQENKLTENSGKITLAAVSVPNADVRQIFSRSEPCSKNWRMNRLESSQVSTSYTFHQEKIKLEEIDDKIATCNIANGNEAKATSGSLSSAKKPLRKLIRHIDGASKKLKQSLRSNSWLTKEAAASKPERNVCSASSSKNQNSIIEKQTAITEDPLLVGKASFDGNDYKTIQSSEKTQENALTEIVENISLVTMCEPNTDTRECVNRTEACLKTSSVNNLERSQISSFDTFHHKPNKSGEVDKKLAACQIAVGNQDNVETVLSEVKTFKIVRCVAFPRIESHSTDLSFIENEANIINACDLDCFSSWWDDNITHLRNGTYFECHGKLEVVKHVLLALWASNDQILDASELGFAKTIIATDKKLRESDITFIRKKKSLNNPDIIPATSIDWAKVKATNIFSDILKINFITEEQNKVFLKQSQKLIITGCIGSGKSLMLLARMIHKKLTNPELPMILLVFNQIKLYEYQNLFKQAEIDCTDVTDTEFNQNLWRNTVGVIHCSTNPDDAKLQLLQNLDRKVHLYVDDAHASNVDFSLFRHVCITLDFNQSLLSRDQSANCGPLFGYEIICLTHNYRSTWNLVSNLTRLSEVIEAKEETQRNFIQFPPIISNIVLSHHPSHGHLIHGPQNVINVLHWDSLFLSESIFTRLLTLYRQKVFQLLPLLDENSFTGRSFLIDQTNNSELQKLFDYFSILAEIFGLSFVKSISHDIFSTEFTACFIILLGCSLDTRNLRLLFNAMSRARAYCEIFLCVDENDDEHELDEFLDIFKGMKIQHVYAPEEAEEEENSVANVLKENVSDSLSLFSDSFNSCVIS